MEFVEGNIRMTVAINEEDVVSWTTDIKEWYGEDVPDILEKEVRAAAQRYIAERGLEKYRTAMQPLDHLVREDLVRMILVARAQPVGQPVFLLSTDERCSRTDEFCPITLDNKDCRFCQFYVG